MRNLYIFLLIGLFIIGYFLCKSNLCSQSANPAAAVGAVTSDQCRTQLSFTDTNLSLKSKENIRFDRSSSEMLTASDDLKNIIQQVANYLNDNPERIMQIKGLYTSEEINDSEEKSLGYARALSVKELFLELNVDNVQLSTIGKLTKNSCFEDEVLLKGISTAFK